MKMKINWGTGIIIAFGLFMSFILFFVFLVQTNSKYDNELVTEDYYKKELEVNANMEQLSNANELTSKVKIENVSDGIRITFPKEFDYQKIEGKVFLYRPSNQKLDTEFEINLSSLNLLIPNSKLVGGLWVITIEWNYQGISYRNKESIYYK